MFKRENRAREAMAKKYEELRLDDGAWTARQVALAHHEKLHDEIVGTAQASVNLSLDKHVEAYRRYLKSKNMQSSMTQIMLD